MYERKGNNTGITKRMFGIDELADYMSVGKTYAARFGKEAGARRTIGRRVLYDREIIDRALTALPAAAQVDA